MSGIFKWILLGVLGVGIGVAFGTIYGMSKTQNIDFKIQKPLESGKNTYTFSGTFFGVDSVKHLIFIKDNIGKVYAFRIDRYLLKDTDLWLRIITVPDINTLAKGIPVDPTSIIQPGTKNLLTSGLQISLTADPQPKDLNIVVVRWNDARNLSQIMTDYKNNPDTAINSASPDNIVLAVIK